MKLIHISDLHLGKRVYEFSMLEDQRFILNQILSVIDAEQPQAVLIAGDVYDKSVPSAEAVQLFDEFLFRLANRKLQVFIISGNHDSAERLAFGGRLMDRSGIHLSQVYSGETEPAVLQDEYGEVRVYMLPFIKPAGVRRFFPDDTVASYTDAVQLAIGRMQVDTDCRNVLVTHQFVTGALKSESEEISVGGSDNVDAEEFDCFDYVALGHIHGPQSVSRETIRYCGTPLKYSFSEADHQKSVTVLELREKGNVQIRTVPLTPLHDMRQIRGTYLEVTSKSFYAGTDTKDYMHVTLTDEEDVPDAIGKLRVIYPNLMKLDYDNQRTRNAAAVTAAADIERKTPLQLFEELYQKQNGQPFSDQQKELVQALIEKIREEAE
ncbi:MAG: exonuclease SbcCD subunit D [Clostridia bacterium]|nr:exonuclease SbcCD subunit D [Clostridia bacterium]